MKYSSIIVSFSFLFLAAPSFAGNLCTSNSFCVHGDMPLLSQSNPEFLKLIGQSKDRGYCGAGASAMIFKTYMNNLSKDHGNSYAKTMKTGSNGKIIKMAGEFVKTNFKKGGTLTSNIAKGYRNFLRYVTPRHSGKYSPNYYSYRPGRRKPVLQKSIFKKDKPIAYISAKAKSKGKTYSHAIVLNGYQDDKFVIYDPWKRIYNVKMIGTSKIAHASGYGFVKYYGGSNGVSISVKGALQNKLYRKASSEQGEAGFVGPIAAQPSTPAPTVKPKASAYSKYLRMSSYASKYRRYLAHRP